MTTPAPSFLPFLLMAIQILIALVLLLAWSVYFFGIKAESEAHPDVMYEWIVFAFLGAMIAGAYHLVFLLFSINNNKAQKTRSPKKVWIRSIILVVFGIAPMIPVCIISVSEAIPLLGYLF